MITPSPTGRPSRKRALRFEVVHENFEAAELVPQRRLEGGYRALAGRDLIGQRGQVVGDALVARPRAARRCRWHRRDTGRRGRMRRTCCRARRRAGLTPSSSFASASASLLASRLSVPSFVELSPVSASSGVVAGEAVDLRADRAAQAVHDRPDRGVERERPVVTSPSVGRCPATPRSARRRTTPARCTPRPPPDVVGHRRGVGGDADLDRAAFLVERQGDARHHVVDDVALAENVVAKPATVNSAFCAVLGDGDAEVGVVGDIDVVRQPGVARREAQPVVRRRVGPRLTTVALAPRRAR